MDWNSIGPTADTSCQHNNKQQLPFCFEPVKWPLQTVKWPFYYILILWARLPSTGSRQSFGDVYLKWCRTHQDRFYECFLWIKHPLMVSPCNWMSSAWFLKSRFLKPSQDTNILEINPFSIFVCVYDWLEKCSRLFYILSVVVIGWLRPLTD